MIVVLMNQGVVEKEQSISEFKKENSISSEINQQFIVNFFEANGYNLEELQDERVVFSKDGTTNVLQPNNITQVKKMDISQFIKLIMKEI